MQNPPETSAARPRLYYGWVAMLLAAFAMVGTLPGRTQGLGLVTEPLMRDLHLSRVEYAQVNLWATLIGALFCISVGRLQDRIGSRIVLTTIALALGATVVGMSRVTAFWPLFVFVTFTRGLGQSALSVVSLTMVGQWFRTKLDLAMAIFTVVMSIGFMIAFPIVGAIVTSGGWRAAWGGIGWVLLLGLAPAALLLAKNPPPALEGEDARTPMTGYSLIAALRTPAFWIMSTASASYGLIASGIGLFNESVLKERGLPASVYHNSLVVTALTALIGNFLGGYLTAKGSMGRLMGIAMVLLMVGLVALANVSTVAHVMIVAVVMGIAGGFVMVLFFSYWGRVYGRAHLGQIQGAAQMMTVLASAIGPLLLAKCVEQTGSYSSVFYGLAVLLAVLAALAWTMRQPAPLVAESAA